MYNSSTYQTLKNSLWVNRKPFLKKVLFSWNLIKTMSYKSRTITPVSDDFTRRLPFGNMLCGMNQCRINLSWVTWCGTLSMWKIGMKNFIAWICKIKSFQFKVKKSLVYREETLLQRLWISLPNLHSKPTDKR